MLMTWKVVQSGRTCVVDEASAWALAIPAYFLSPVSLVASYSISRFICVFQYYTVTRYDETHHVVDDGEVVFMLIIPGVTVRISDFSHLIP